MKVMSAGVNFSELLVAMQMFFMEAVPPWDDSDAERESLMISPLVPEIGFRENEVLVRR